MSLCSEDGGATCHKEGADGDQGSDRRSVGLCRQDGQTEEGLLR